MDFDLKDTVNAYKQVTMESAAEVKMYLEHTYGTIFKPLRVGNRFNTHTATVYVRDGSNERVVFKAVLDHYGNVEEDYVSQCILTQMGDSVITALEAVGIPCEINASFGREIHESDKNITIRDFLSKYGIKRIVLQMILLNMDPDAEKIIQQYVTFLRSNVDSGYEATENTNINLSKNFK